MSNYITLEKTSINKQSSPDDLIGKTLKLPYLENDIIKYDFHKCLEVWNGSSLNNFRIILDLEEKGQVVWFIDGDDEIEIVKET